MGKGSKVKKKKRKLQAKAELNGTANVGKEKTRTIRKLRKLFREFAKESV